MRLSRPLAIFAVASLVTLASAQQAKPVKPHAPSAKPSTVTLPLPGGPSGSFLGGTDDCASPQVIMGTGLFPFDLTSATTGTEGQAEALCYAFGTSGIDTDVWFCWTAGVDGCTRVQTCNINNGVDTKIAIYPDCGCPTSGSAIVCNDDMCPGFATLVEWTATAGTTYTIQLGTFPGGAIGSGQFEVVNPCPPPATNDDCMSPDVLPGPGAYNFDLTLATTGAEGQAEALCYAFGTSGIDNDVWYCYTADCAGDATVSTCGLTTVDTKIAVYPDCGCPGFGASLACNDDTCGLQSTVQWQTSPGATYTIQLGTFPGAAQGTGMFSLTLEDCQASGVPLCFGDGSGTTCGCGNDVPAGAGSGCENSLGIGGIATGNGFASFANDDFEVVATQIPIQPCLFFQGDISLNGGQGVPFGDGLRCCGQGVIRLVTVVPDPDPNVPGAGIASTLAGVGGPGTPVAQFPGPISQHPANTGLMPGDTRCYQCWYRDPSPMAPCGSTFNLTNALEVLWLP